MVNIGLFHFVSAANELKVICTWVVSCWNVVRNGKCCTRWLMSYRMRLLLLCVSSFRLKHCRYGSQNKTEQRETQQSKSYGGSWRRSDKIWIKVTDISIWVMETFMVLVSGWLDCPVWVALERHWVRLQTISIPLDQGCKTGLEMSAVPCPLPRQERDQCEGGRGGE